MLTLETLQWFYSFHSSTCESAQYFYGILIFTFNCWGLTL